MMATTTLTIGDDLAVYRFGFGAMRITGDGIWGEPSDASACRDLLRRIVQTDVNLIDTADSYGPEVSERLIAEALHPYPDNVVIATKGGLERPGPNRWVANCRPERLRRCCEDSLRRLKLERIDLYQLHRVDPNLPIEDSVGALAELREEQKIRHIGLSNVNLEQLERAREMVPIVSVQNRYNVADRESEEVLQACEESGLAFFPWAPLGSRGSSNLAQAVRPAGRGRQSSRSLPRSGRAGVAAAPLPGDPADPRDQFDYALRGEPRSSRARARRG